MPELPEVETVVRSLRASLVGRSIIDVRLGKTDFIDDPAELERYLPGSRVAAITRFGKYISIEIEPRSPGGAKYPRFIVHLGMTGRLTICHPEEPIPPHTHCFFGLDNGQELRYTDPRRFGRMLMASDDAMEKFHGRLGAEPLEIRAEDFVRKFTGRAARVKAMLLDQAVIRGIGNIYADEALFRAGIHPARLGRNLSRKQLLALYRAVRAVLNAAIRLRGSSIADYVDSTGRKGEFQQRHRVYQREGKPCPVCRTPIRRIVVAGRSSHFCPRCQPPPRRPKSTKPRKRKS
jgi:formamidopyrimidine-DNA glycosylase